MNERREREERERKTDAEFARKMLSDNQQAIQAEKDKERKRKEAAVAYKSRLVEQHREQKMAETIMETDQAVTVTERAINKKIFDKLKSDGDLIAKIQSRYQAPERPDATGQSSNSKSDRGKTTGGGGGRRAHCPRDGEPQRQEAQHEAEEEAGLGWRGGGKK